jgi:hypothetical protein
MHNRVFIVSFLLLVISQQAMGQSLSPLPLEDVTFSVGDEAGNVKWLELISVSDKGLKTRNLAKYDTLFRFSIASCFVTDDSRDELCKLPMDLVSLSIVQSKVGDKTLVPLLRRLTALQMVSFEGIVVNKATLIEIGKLRELWSLSLRSSRLDADCLDCLQRCHDLWYLNVSCTGLGKDDLKHLQKLKNLKWLCIGNTGVTDKDMPFIAEMTKLEYVDLSDTNVTDHGLMKLEKLSRLRKIDITRTKITKEGKAALQAKKPHIVFIDLAK